MGGRIASLLGSSVVYMASIVLQRGLAFLLIPLYAAYFSAAEFGAMDILYQLALALALLGSLGLPQGLVRGLHRGPGGEAPTEDERQRLLGALATFLIPVGLLATAVLLACAEPIARLVFREEGRADWVRLAVWLHLAMVLQQLPMHLLKASQRAMAYATWSLAAFLVTAGGNVLLIAGFGMGLEGMLWGHMAGAGATAAGLTVLLLRESRPNLQWRLLAPLFAFGLPMLPNLLCRRVLETANRYMLPAWHGLAEVGLFSMGARVAAIVDLLLLIPFVYAWQPFFYAQASRPEAPRLFARVTHYFLLVLLSVVLAVLAFQAELLHALGRGKFAGAGPVVVFLGLGIVCNGLQYCVSAGIHIRGKLGAELALMAGSAAAAVPLNLALIPPYGAAGAAAATALAYLLYLAGSLVLAQRHYPVPYAWGRAGHALAAALAAGLLLHFTGPAYGRALILAGFLALGPLWDLGRNGELGPVLALAARAPGLAFPRLARRGAGG